VGGELSPYNIERLDENRSRSRQRWPEARENFGKLGNPLPTKDAFTKAQHNLPSRDNASPSRLEMVRSKEGGGLPLREIGCAVDEIAEASVTDRLGSVFHIFRCGINSTGGKRRVILESAGGFADIARKSPNEIRASPLLR
jgi:hypothetical protein